MMYDELVKRLRIGTKYFPGYILYPDGGVQPFYLTPKDIEQAADAIEGLELYCKNFEEALKELDEKLDEPQYPWIPVKERLPEKNGDYIAFSIGGTWNQLSTIELAFWDGASFIAQSFLTVTHWMPLPEPPTIIEAEVKDGSD